MLEFYIVPIYKGRDFAVIGTGRADQPPQPKNAEGGLVGEQRWRNCQEPPARTASTSLLLVRAQTDTPSVSLAWRASPQVGRVGTCRRRCVRTPAPRFARWRALPTRVHSRSRAAGLAGAVVPKSLAGGVSEADVLLMHPRLCLKHGFQQNLAAPTQAPTRMTSRLGPDTDSERRSGN